MLRSRRESVAVHKFYCGGPLLRRPAVEEEAPQLERFFTLPKLPYTLNIVFNGEGRKQSEQLIQDEFDSYRHSQYP